VVRAPTPAQGNSNSYASGGAARAVRTRLPEVSERALINTHSDVEGGHRFVGDTTAATLLDAHGASVATIGMSLGHKRGSATTLRYITPDVERAREAVNKVSRAVRSAEA
jgi:hypothetical protein